MPTSSVIIAIHSLQSRINGIPCTIGLHLNHIPLTQVVQLIGLCFLDGMRDLMKSLPLAEQFGGLLEVLFESVLHVIRGHAQGRPSTQTMKMKVSTVSSMSCGRVDVYARGLS